MNIKGYSRGPPPLFPTIFLGKTTPRYSEIGTFHFFPLLSALHSLHPRSSRHHGVLIRFRHLSFWMSAPLKFACSNFPRILCINIPEEMMPAQRAYILLSNMTVNKGMKRVNGLCLSPVLISYHHVVQNAEALTRTWPFSRCATFFPFVTFFDIYIPLSFSKGMYASLDATISFPELRSS